MKKGTILLVVLVFFAASVSGQKETRDLKGFSEIGFGVSGTLYISIGNDFSVELEGSKDFLDEIITEISGDKLIIRKENWRLHMNERVTVRITMPSLEGLSVSGSGNAQVMDPVSADALNLSVSGSGKILAGKLEADDLSCNISGSGNIEVTGEGSVDDGQITISGSGNYTGENLEIDHLEIRLSGSGNCRCRAGDSLTASVSGSGNVSYAGNPKIDARVSGSGKIRSM